MDNESSQTAQRLNLARQIVALRDRIDYMTVARAMVFLAGEMGAGMAERLGVSRQTRHNWDKPESRDRWFVEWTGRMESMIVRSPAPQRTRRVISTDEWRWMATVLSSTPASSWGKRRLAVASAAAKEAKYSHLRFIGRVTLYRNRDKLTALGDELRRKGSFLRQVTNAPVSKSEELVAVGPVRDPIPTAAETICDNPF